MGTIVIEEYANAGGPGSVDGAPVNNLDGVIVTTVDATTSTSAENITLDMNTRFVSIYAVEDHRVSIKADTTGSAYGFIPATTIRDFAVKGGEALYFRTNA